MIVAVEYNESFSESDQSAYQEGQQSHSDFNHPSEDCINYVSTDLSAEMMSAHNDDQNSRR